ncbi:MAG: protein kinase [Proteobacteria bacterium]|nr:protein kinase [Pseudomonadota bacterium]
MSEGNSNLNLPTEIENRFVVGTKILERPNCLVFKGIDKSLGDKSVAIKFFIDKPEKNQKWIDAFNSEIAILKNSSHRSLVPVVAGGLADGWFFMVMELIEGMTLRDYLKGLEVPLDVDIAIDIISKIAQAVGELHEKNYYHGHIDSRAIMFKGQEPRLAGFYPHVIAEIQKNLTTAGRLIIDPAYIAPEQIVTQDKVGPRADIFSLSVLLYEILTLKRPFVSDNPMNLAMLRLTGSATPPQKVNTNIPAIVDAAIVKGLTKEPEHRFATVDEFIDALNGGKKEPKNPLLEAIGGVERLSGTETMQMSMSTEEIKKILKNHELQEKMAKEMKTQPSTSATATNLKAHEEVKTEKQANNQGADQSFNAVETMIGMKTDQLLKANLVVISEKNRGQKYLLQRSQMIIGSDERCDISLEGKDIPARFAIIVEKSGSYAVAPLSSSAVKVNKQSINSNSEYTLKRGDILNIGEYRLRYVAPGEVFTLDADVAERVIDKPKSKIPLILTAVTSVAIIVCGTLFYFYNQSLEENKMQAKLSADGKKSQRKELLEKLRKEGDTFFQAGALIEPTDANARKRFEQMIEIDPENTYAKRRLSEIGERLDLLSQQKDKQRQISEKVNQLLADADKYYNSGSFISPPGANARDLYQEVIKMDPQNKVAQEKLALITKNMSDILGQVNSYLTKAQEFITLKQYVFPEGENAKELIDKVFSVDSSNKEARNLLYDMAARCILEGDVAKSKLQAEEAKKSYLTAQAIGVSPDFIDKKLQGIELIKHSSSSVIIVDSGSSRNKEEKKKVNDNYLDETELEKHLSTLKLQGAIAGSEEKSKFYEINKK